MSRAVILLADLDSPVGHVKFPDGREVPVHAVDGIAMQLVQELQAGHNATLVWKVALRCLRGASEHDVMALTLDQVNAVIALATGTANGVLDELGKGTGATGGTTAADAPPTS